MNTDTSTQVLGVTHDFVSSIPGILAKGMVDGVKLVWNAIIPDLFNHWLFWMTVYFIILLIATLKAMMRQWGMFGSVIYNSIYFGILLIIGLLFGPQVFVDDVFKAACTVILYPVCYLLTSWIINITKARRGFR